MEGFLAAALLLLAAAQPILGSAITVLNLAASHRRQKQRIDFADRTTVTLCVNTQLLQRLQPVLLPLLGVRG